MATLVLTRGSHEARLARKAYKDYPDVTIRDVRYGPHVLRGVKWADIIFTDWCKQSEHWNSHVLKGIMYQMEQGANIQCLDS